MISQIYEKNAEYQDAKDILLLAYERAPLGKGLLYKLTDLALRENNIQEAEAYYREFCELSGDDPRQYLLRFLILEAKDAPLEQQINSLESWMRNGCTTWQSFIIRRTRRTTVCGSATRSC